MNWYKKAQSSVMFHHTSENRLALILKKGLKINSPWNESLASKDYIEQVYGMKPIFLTLDPTIFKEKYGDVILSCVIDPNNLVADIPSLYDHGAYIEEDGIWWETGKEPPALLNYIDSDPENGDILYYDLLDPHSEVAKACIQLTKTAAYLKDISPQNIKLYDELV